jgi:hypothetical protein
MQQQIHTGRPGAEGGCALSNHGIRALPRRALGGWIDGKRPKSRSGSEILGAGAAAQRGRWSPSFLMRDSRVVGLRPSSVAAPAGPRQRNDRRGDRCSGDSGADGFGFSMAGHSVKR